MTEHGSFTCAECGLTFEMAWSDEESRAEAEVHGFDPDHDPIVCDPCFTLLMAANNHPIGTPRTDKEPT